MGTLILFFLDDMKSVFVQDDVKTTRELLGLPLKGKALLKSSQVPSGHKVFLRSDRGPQRKIGANTIFLYIPSES